MKPPYDVVQPGRAPVVARALRDARFSRGSTQQHVADKIGVSFTIVSSFESGRRRPRADRVPRLAELLELDEETVVLLFVSMNMVLDRVAFRSLMSSGT